MNQRHATATLALSLLLAACGPTTAPQADTLPVTLSVASLGALGKAGIQIQGLPYNASGTGVREVKLTVTDAQGNAVRFNSQNVVDPNGNVTYFVLTPSAPAVKVALLKSTNYSFTTRAYDASVLNAGRHLIAFDTTSKAFSSAADTGLILTPRSVLGAGTLSSLPLNMVVPGQSLDYLLGVSANGRADLNVPTGDYAVTYQLSNATDTATTDPKRGITLQAAGSPAGDLSVTAELTGLVPSGTDDAVPGTRTVTVTLPFASGLQVDLTAPTLQNLSAGTPAGDAVTVSGTVNDNLGVARVRLYAGARLLQTVPAAAFTGTTFTTTVTGLKPTDSTLTVIAEDTSGNEVTGTVAVAMGAQVNPASLYVNPAVTGGNGSYAAPFGSLQDALALVTAGGTIHLGAGEYPASLTINKAVRLEGPNAGVAGTASRSTEATFTGIVTLNGAAAGSVLDGVRFLTTQHGAARNMLSIQVSGVTVLNSVFEGAPLAAGQTWKTAGYVTRGMDISGSLSGLVIRDNVFRSLRQPAYINANTTGLIENNTIIGTRGWVLDGAPVTLTGNRFEQTEEADIALLNNCTSAAFRALDSATLSQQNAGALISDQRTC